MTLTSIWAMGPPMPLTPPRTTMLVRLHSTKVLMQRKTGKSSPLPLSNYHDVCVCSDNTLYCAGVTSSPFAQGRLPRHRLAPEGYYTVNAWPEAYGFGCLMG